MSDSISCVSLPSLGSMSNTVIVTALPAKQLKPGLSKVRCQRENVPQKVKGQHEQTPLVYQEEKPPVWRQGTLAQPRQALIAHVQGTEAA